MPSIPASFFDGQSSRRYPVQLTVSAAGLCVEGEWGQRVALFSEVHISEPMGTAPRTVRFNDGAYCEVAELGALAAVLEQAGYRETHTVRMHSRWRWALGALVAVAGFLAVAYFFLLPWAAAVLAPRIPPVFSEHISAMTLKSMDEHLLQPSTLPLQRQLALQDKMRFFAARAGDIPAYQLHFRAAPKMPPNAFALPNGELVVFDSLAEKLSDGEVIAVLSHELGHVAYYHGLRRLMQSAVVSVFAAVYFGDVSSVAAALAAASLESHYSQEFELAADHFGALALARAGMAPTYLADALEKLERTETKEESGGWLSSHPESMKRISLLRGAK